MLMLYCGHCREDFVATNSDVQPPYAAMVVLGGDEPLHVHPITREKLLPVEEWRLWMVELWSDGVENVEIYRWLGMTSEEYARWLLGDDYREQGFEPYHRIFDRLMREAQQKYEQEKRVIKENRWWRRWLREMRRQ